MSDPPDRAASALTVRAAAVARRVANLLPSPASDADAAFLREWADVVTTTPGADIGTATGPMDLLVAGLALTDLEADLLVLAGLPEEHEGLADVFRSVHPQHVPRPGVGLATRLAEASGMDRAQARRLLHEGRAVAVGVLRLLGDGPLPERTLAPAAGLWEVLHGGPGWPPELEPVPLDDGPPGLDDWLRQPAVRRAAAALGLPGERVLLVTAEDEVVGLSRCAALAVAAGVALAGARVRPDDAAGVQLLGVHAAARGAVPLLVVPPPAQESGAVRLELDGLTGPVVVCAAPGSVRPPVSRAVLGVPTGPVGVEGRRAAWRAALPEAAGRAPELAARHPLDPALTAQVALDLRAAADLLPDEDEPGRRAAADQVPAVVRARAGVVLPAGVQLMAARAGWDRLVLTGDAGEQLRDAVARLDVQAQVLDDWGMRHRARADRGVRLLFTGPPGTGKSLAAEVVATAAGTDLLVVDVSRVVSKWLGETEKNLAAAFDIAQRTQAVLFLDEADVTFGTRTEISDAQDRYANLETAYLLQRLDSFDGLAVLATNLRQNIDAAFVRRMDFVIDFPLPDEDSRLKLWKLHLPPERLGDGVDLAALARRYPVPGGWIRNAAIAAAFLAARDGSAIDGEHLEAAMDREYGKALRPAPDGAPEPGQPVDGRAEAALAQWAAEQAQSTQAHEEES
jgi:hypothetical protein